MSKRNVKKIIIGLVLIVVAVAVALIAFYYLEVKPTIEEENQQESSSSVITAEPLAKPQIEQKTKEDARVLTATNKSMPSPIRAQQEKSSVNIPRERKEGFLWVDRKSSKFVITLGATQGISSGERFSVYDNGQKIGQVVTRDVYDTISYVNPLDIDPQSFQNDYYRAVRE